MPDFLRAYVERAATGGKAGEPMRFIASTENVARDGMVIPADAWQLDNFQKNPVFLFSHDYFSRPPIGKVTEITAEDDRLMADVVFDQGDPFAVDIERKYRAGFLSAVSVGWDTLAFEPPNGPNTVPRVTKADLLDVSAVMVPSDPDALKERQKRGLASVVEELTKIIEPAADEDNAQQNAERTADPPPASATWDDTAAAMVRLFRPFAQRPDAARRPDYQRLARDYGRHTKTAPEFQTNAQLEALGADELRGLFLEGEADLFPDEFAWFDIRAGAALNARNRERLEQAAALIADVLSSVKKQTEEDDERAIRAMATSLDDLFAGVST